MQLLLIIVGAIVGAWLADASDELFGIAIGAALGYGLARLIDTRARIARLEAELGVLRRATRAAAAPAAKEDALAADAEAAAAPGGSPAADPRVARATLESPATSVAGPAASGAAAASAGPAEARGSRGAAAAPRGPSPFERALAAGRRWLTTGNVPVKLGVIISFFGVAFLLKYAIDRELLRLPIELRLLAVSAGAAAMLVVGWRLRSRNAVYALSLQGGGIGILYLDIFAAFRLYELLPATFAFALLVLLTAAVGVLAVLQDSRWLAIFGTVGGFLAPLLTSTGSGNHVALFSYYLVLNGAILGISWFRAWRELNLLGFVFTFGVGTLWGAQYYRPELYASTQPFLVLYFLFYQAIAVLYAFRQAPALRSLVDGTIVFGTPVVAFALQSRLVEGSEYGLAISAAAVAVFYVLLAGWLYRVHRETLRLLVDSFVSLGVAFATIAIPLALDARWTAAAWTLEGAALVWIGVRQGGLLARASGALLIFAGGIAFIESGWQSGTGLPVLNGNFLGGILVALSALFAANRLQHDRDPLPAQGAVAWLLLAWGVSWWLAVGAFEIADRIDARSEWYWRHALLVFVMYAALSSCALAVLARNFAWRQGSGATLVLLPVLLLAALGIFVDGRLLAGLGWVAWPLALAGHLFVLRLREPLAGRREPLWHGAGAVFFVALAGLEAGWLINKAGLARAWSDAALIVTLAAGGWALRHFRVRYPWPLASYGAAYTVAAVLLAALALVGLAALGVDHNGSADPLAYLPVLNPYDVATAVALVLALRLLLVLPERAGPVALPTGKLLLVWGVAALLLTTIAVVRAVHHLGDVPWIRGTLLASTSVQAALSIYWGLLGFAGMITGARLGRRLLWMLGTGMMALVVVKLFIVDLGNSGTVARIVSFLGVGILLLVVGYFAPAPPRRSSGEEAA